MLLTNNDAPRPVLPGGGLSADAGELSAERISALLECPGVRVTVLDCVDSTNSEAKRRAAAGVCGTELIAAVRQTAGRGRMGRAFYSPADTGLYMSLLLPCPEGFERAVYSTTAAAAAVVRAIERLTPLRPMIKWVNDIYLDGRKICGILTEAVTDSVTGAFTGVVVGVGVNLKTSCFPPELEHIASSLGEAAPDRCALAAAITDELLAITDALPDRSFLEFYRSRSLVIGRRITYTANGAAHGALAVGIDGQGGLIVRTDSGERITLSSGEISLRLAADERP